jgi:hypothetical protein
MTPSFLAMTVAVVTGWPWRRGVSTARLRYQKNQWILSEAVQGRESLVGKLHVRIDLGAWMLCRFMPVSRGQPSTWLVLQRAGQRASDWHILRCIVHASENALRPARHSGSA